MPAAQFSPGNRKRLSGPGMRTFLAISDVWGLSEVEQSLVLGYPARSTFRRRKTAAREHREITLSVDTLTRIAAILGIHGSLTLLYITEREGVDWLRLPNKATVFGGSAPLDLVISGNQDKLMLVKNFLDAVRGGIFMEPVASLDRGFVLHNDGDLDIS